VGDEEEDPGVRTVELKRGRGPVAGPFGFRVQRGESGREQHGGWTDLRQGAERGLSDEDPWRGRWGWAPRPHRRGEEVVTKIKQKTFFLRYRDPEKSKGRISLNLAKNVKGLSMPKTDYKRDATSKRTA